MPCKMHASNGKPMISEDWPNRSGNRVLGDHSEKCNHRKTAMLDLLCLHLPEEEICGDGEGSAYKQIAKRASDCISNMNVLGLAGAELTSSFRAIQA